MNEEKDYSPVSGYVMLLVVLIALGLSILVVSQIVCLLGKGFPRK